jgi:SAM-dependent methyltransferase
VPLDYDRSGIPAGYDCGRDHGPEWLERWMHVIASHLAGRRVASILDLGCGTGRFTEGLATRFEAEVVGVDPSMKMLERARQKSRLARVHYARGTAEALPLASGSVDLVFLSMSFHHFPDPHRAARECRRAIRDTGTVLVRTATREQIPWYPYVPFFPGTRAMLQELLPDLATLGNVFGSAGFRLVTADVVRQTIAPDWGAYAQKLAAGADSVLARLSARDLEHGLRALEEHARSRPPEPIVEPVDLVVFHCDQGHREGASD